MHLKKKFLLQKNLMLYFHPLKFLLAIDLFRVQIYTLTQNATIEQVRFLQSL